VRDRETGLRLIDWLAGRFTYRGMEAWRGELAAGRVVVNGDPAAAEVILAAGDLVRYRPAGIEEPPVDPSWRLLLDEGPLLVVEKSGNLPVHPGGRYFERCLLRLLEADYGRLHVLTRLDRETSGLVLLARRGPELPKLQSLIEDGGIAKEYLAIVHGDFPTRIRATGRLLRDTASLVRKKRRFVAAAEDHGGEGEWADTELEPMARRALPSVGTISLVRVRTRTGRTHQIRATLLGLGHPVLGDKLYGLDEGCFVRQAAGELTEADRVRLILPSQALHASRLSIEREGLPRLIVSSPAPAAWAELLPDEPAPDPGRPD
jgi:23S rRNA-/tRNA-specific pseudouridylate synthase